MAQFKALRPDVWVAGDTVQAFVNSMPTGMDTRKSILMNHGIDADPNKWYLQQSWLDAYKEVAESLGDMNLFLMGKAVISNAIFPPINNLEEGLKLLDVAYHMNHKLQGKVMFDTQSGEMQEGIGNYKLTSYDSAERLATMVCNNPYPSKFDEGIITQLVRTFRPNDSYRQSVSLNYEKPTRRDGGESCEFLIQW